MRYVGGYVARKLLLRYEKMFGDVYNQYITCLGEMAVAGEGEGDSLLSYTTKWMDTVNRGGLYHLNDETFHLFIEIEKCVQTYLPKYLAQSKTSDKELYIRNIHDKILENEDVQFHWTLLSQDIESAEDSHCLLSEVVKLFVTVRGFAIVGSWMEIYKSKEKINTQKSTGLRKSLSGQS